MKHIVQINEKNVVKPSQGAENARLPASRHAKLPVQSAINLVNKNN
jgi:hypothetical protein